MADKKYEDRQEMKDTWIDAQKLVSTSEVRNLSKGKNVSQRIVFDLYLKGDVAELDRLKIPISKEDREKLEKRGNIMENFVNSPKYESLEGTISRMVR